MKKRLFLVTLAFLFLTILIQCNNANKNDEKSSDNLKKSLEEKNKKLQNRKKELTKDYNTIIEILSLKYEIDTTLTKEIIIGYLISTDLEYHFISSFDPKKIESLKLDYGESVSIIEFANSISITNKTIDKKTIGEILFDLESIREIKELETRMHY